jgi:hypothetical protein
VKLSGGGRPSGVRGALRGKGRVTRRSEDCLTAQLLYSSGRGLGFQSSIPDKATSVLQHLEDNYHWRVLSTLVVGALLSVADYARSGSLLWLALYLRLGGSTIYEKNEPVHLSELAPLDHDANASNFIVICLPWPVGPGSHRDFPTNCECTWRQGHRQAAASRYGSGSSCG